MEKDVTNAGKNNADKNMKKDVTNVLMIIMYEKGCH